MQVYSNNTSHRQDIDLTQTSTVLRIQHLELALERAVEDISLLQSNLAYVIRIKEQLQAQLAVRQKREEAIMKEYQREILRRDKQNEAMRQNQEELASLLQQVKSSLESSQSTIRQRDDEKRRLERIVEDQKSTLRALQEELLATKYSADISYQNITQDNLKFQQLQRQNEQLRFDQQKIKNQMERATVRARKYQKEVQIFKSWLGNVLGVRKVVEGCESILMEQISNRLNGAKY